MRADLFVVASVGHITLIILRIRERQTSGFPPSPILRNVIRINGFQLDFKRIKIISPTTACIHITRMCKPAGNNYSALHSFMCFFRYYCAELRTENVMNGKFNYYNNNNDDMYSSSVVYYTHTI